MALIKVQRGQIWEVDFEPQAHKEEPGKRNRPALAIQTDLLNNAGHPTTIVVVGTTKLRRDQDYFPLRVALTNQSGLPQETDAYRPNSCSLKSKIYGSTTDRYVKQQLPKKGRRST